VRYVYLCLVSASIYPSICLRWSTERSISFFFLFPFLFVYTVSVRCALVSLAALFLDFHTKSTFLSYMAGCKNTSLMKWRRWPSLRLQEVRATKVLIVGAGTLGCAVGRLLLAWGITRVTFVDSGRVSPSNPARQCLFDEGDVGTFKASTAAAALQRVRSDVRAEAHCLRSPMPGHPVLAGEESEALRALQSLNALVHSHDVVFAVTDSRESRWLPTLLATTHNKVPALEFLFIYPSTNLHTIYLSIYLFIHPSISLSSYLSALISLFFVVCIHALYSCAFLSR
jgi:molybdopterin/thiamine biosynthesis adenylyltransferase